MVKYTAKIVPETGEYCLNISNNWNKSKIIEYEVEISDGTDGFGGDGPYLTITQHYNEMAYGVMSISKPSPFTEHYMTFSNDYVVDITWRRNAHVLISLVFKMFLPVERYEELISGERSDVDKKVLKFYLNAVKTLTDLQNSFPL